jgi:hypothetical protein
MLQLNKHNIGTLKLEGVCLQLLGRKQLSEHLETLVAGTSSSSGTKLCWSGSLFKLFQRPIDKGP